MGFGLFIAMFFLVSIAIILYAVSREDYSTSDVGDALERMERVSEYAFERLGAARAHRDLPEPPAILANQQDLRFAMMATLGSQVAVAAVVLYASRQRLRGFIRATGLDQFHSSRLGLIIGLVFAAYVGLFLYSIAAAATGISWLEPNSTVPRGVTRSDLTLTITGIVTLVGAPISEEMFFRGLVFGGLLKWGFWPAALASGLAFSFVHFDPGSLVPFIGIAVLLAWVYWRRGSLWDSIAFHFVFNLISFGLMVATR